MSLAVLDTDRVTLLRRGDPHVVPRVAEHPAAEVALTIVTVEELLAGWYAQIRQARSDEKVELAYLALHQPVTCCGRIRLLDFDATSIQRFRALRAIHRRIGTVEAGQPAHGACS
jgi:predicted nucleic acid-binding protein